jgi:hypothetical protein
MGSDASKENVAYLPLTRCQETTGSALNRQDGYAADFNRCVGTATRTPAGLTVTSMTRNRATCDTARQGETKIKLGETYPEACLTTYPTYAQAEAQARASYAHEPEDLGCAWVDRGWVD